MSLYGNPNITGPLPPDWSTGLFRPSPTSLNNLNQSMSSLYLSANPDPNPDYNEWTNSEFSPYPTFQYLFSDTGVSGKIPAKWSKQCMSSTQDKTCIQVFIHVHLVHLATASNPVGFTLEQYVCDGPTLLVTQR